MTSPFSARRVAGVVFDIDGTLLDNMPFHIEAFEAFTAATGLPPLTLEMRKWMDGRRNADIFPRLFERTLTEDVGVAVEVMDRFLERVKVGLSLP